MVTFPQVLDRGLELTVSCRQSDWQLVWTLPSDSYSRGGTPLRPEWAALAKTTSTLSHLFTAAEDVYTSSEFTPRITAAALRTPFLDELLTLGPVRELLASLLPHDGLPVTPFLFLAGKECSSEG
jgi:hypothetical protein